MLDVPMANEQHAMHIDPLGMSSLGTGVVGDILSPLGTGVPEDILSSFGTG